MFKFIGNPRDCSNSGSIFIPRITVFSREILSPLISQYSLYISNIFVSPSCDVAVAANDVAAVAADGHQQLCERLVFMRQP
jgi:hypothetical protein